MNFKILHCLRVWSYGISPKRFTVPAVPTVLQSGTKVRKDLNGGWAEGAG